MHTHGHTFRWAAPSLAAALLVLTAARVTHAQARLAGEWFVRYELLVRNLHDADPHAVNETAVMTLRLRGDSVFGYWQRPSDPGDVPPTPSSVRGTVHGDSVHVQIDPPPPDDDGFFADVGREIVQFLKTHVHNMPPMTTHLEFVARGDSLVGTRRAVSADGSRQVLPRPMTAIRGSKPQE